MSTFAHSYYPVFSSAYIKMIFGEREIILLKDSQALFGWVRSALRRSRFGRKGVAAKVDGRENLAPEIEDRLAEHGAVPFSRLKGQGL